MPLNEHSSEHFSGHVNLNELLLIMEQILIIMTRIFENSESNAQLELLKSIDSKLGGRGIPQYAPTSTEQDIMRAFGV